MPKRPEGPDESTPIPRRWMLREASAVALLVALVVVVFALGWQRTSAERWQLPTRYSGDDVHSLALLKAARDGNLVPLVPLRAPELGAPNAANWNGFLRQHKLQWYAGGVVARATSLGLASNLMLLGTHLLSALAFYGVARHLRSCREWALTGALLFAFAPFMFWRGFGHLTVAPCWPIPLALLALGWCAARTITSSSFRSVPGLTERRPRRPIQGANGRP